MSQVYIGSGKKEKLIGRGFSSKIIYPYLIQQRIKSEVPNSEQAEGRVRESGPKRRSKQAQDTNLHSPGLL